MGGIDAYGVRDGHGWCLQYSRDVIRQSYETALALRDGVCWHLNSVKKLTVWYAADYLTNTYTAGQSGLARQQSRHTALELGWLSGVHRAWQWASMQTHINHPRCGR